MYVRVCAYVCVCLGVSAWVRSLRVRLRTGWGTRHGEGACDGGGIDCDGEGEAERQMMVVLRVLLILGW